jgi:hypothetical protein
MPVHASRLNRRRRGGLGAGASDRDGGGVVMRQILHVIVWLLFVNSRIGDGYAGAAR